VRNTVVAIDKMDRIAKRTSGITIPGASPGFIDTAELIQSGRKKSSNIVNIYRKYSRAPYGLLFGKTIIEKSHTDAATRIECVEKSEHKD